MKSYGRAPTFLMATGYEQVRSVVAALAGDRAAAGAVELDLPETGVCSTDLVTEDQPPGAADGCCGDSCGTEPVRGALQTVPAETGGGSCCGSEPQPVTIGAGAPGQGFATGRVHGRFGDAERGDD